MIMNASVVSFWITTVSMVSAAPATSLLRGSETARSERDLRDPANIRFNKFLSVVEGAQLEEGTQLDPNPFPLVLMPADYPLSEENASILRHDTMAVSVVVAGDLQLDSWKARYRNAKYWLEGNDDGNVRGSSIGENSSALDPVFPGDPEGKYWDELRHVVEVQIARRDGVSPSDLNTWPTIWNDKYTTLDDIARAVQGEYPASHQQALIETLLEDGLEMTHDMGQPFRSVNDFIGKEIRIATINTWAFETVSPVVFLLKWHIGMPRPEEMAWRIATTTATAMDGMEDAHGIPMDLVRLVQSMELEHATDFTAYEKGSPTHPSFPAMHSAGSIGSTWLPVVCDLTAGQYCEALRTDYAVAYARTIAGVHSQQDNMAGLNLGQRIVRMRLPSMLSERYGYDPALVTRKLEALAFDWGTFDSDDCTIDGVSAADILAKVKDVVSKTSNGKISKSKSKTKKKDKHD